MITQLIDFKITQEMKDWYIKRTTKHIQLVQKYCEKIYNYESVYFFDIIERGILHDQSKWLEPEVLPYIILTWQYYCKDNNIDFEVPDDINDIINKATEYHIVNNRHHPEYFCGRTSNLLDKNDRDGNSPYYIIDATGMEDIDIAEMVADWCAMGEERGNSPLAWAQKNINIRWDFDRDQIKLIYELINEIWE